ncbi:hypothetical protein [Flavobacterium hungaricum]|uniref:hypothetical protein n=1 Tax=Flavobacterium hungaricum TaxID=2082725 RepID=UPI00187F5DA6|nr:hypothetical protein [Flavobacterium hungaricum]
MSRIETQMNSNDLEIIKKKVNENDLVAIEYSKQAFWILKIEHNGLSIENKSMTA